MDMEPVYPLLEELPGAVLVLDEQGVIRFMNRIAEHRLDQSREAAEGRDLFREVLPTLERDGHGDEFRAAMRRPPAALAWESSVGDGPNGRQVGFGMRTLECSHGTRALVLVEDRSPLASERNRRRRAERLAAVGELAAGAAHEINNPLASIKGFAQLLARETLDRGQQQALGIISQECSRVARIVDNLLDFATQQRSAEQEVFDVTAVVESVLALKRYALETSGISIEVDVDGGLSRIEGERGAIQRLMLILICQAERSLSRKEGDKVLSLRARETNEGVVVYVADNGPGVPRHLLPQLLDEDDQRSGGLGLNSAHIVARDHGGTLWVESGEGKGTTVTVRLPRAVVRVPRVPEIVEEVEPPEQEEVEEGPVRVLVADDEPTLRLALAMFLGRHGFEVAQAENVAEALKLVESEQFEVALIDVRMPGDGLTLIDRLDQDPAWQGQAILMTGDHTLARVREEIRSGRPHLTKPFDMMDAVRLVQKFSESGVEPMNQPSPWTSS